MRPQAVIFDWGGTLTPWHDIDLVQQWQFYASVYDSTDTALARRLADAELELWHRQRASGGADGTGNLDHLFAAAGIDTHAERHGLALAAYLEAWEPHTLADPQARPLMVALRERGLRIGVLSNTMWPRWHHEAVFSRDGLGPLIDGAIYSSELDFAKPHAEAFHAAAASVGVSPHAVVFVGDRPWDDVHGAQQAGMRAVLLPHSRLGDQSVPVDVTPDAVIVQLLDLVAVVDEWLKGRRGDLASP